MTIPNNKCRNCNHHHMYVRYGGSMTLYCVVQTCSYMGGCGCHHFIPLDNLDYLEYELAQRGK